MSALYPPTNFMVYCIVPAATIASVAYGESDQPVQMQPVMMQSAPVMQHVPPAPGEQEMEPTEPAMQNMPAWAAESQMQGVSMQPMQMQPMMQPMAFAQVGSSAAGYAQGDFAHDGSDYHYYNQGFCQPQNYNLGQPCGQLPIPPYGQQLGQFPPQDTTQECFAYGGHVGYQMHGCTDVSTGQPQDDNLSNKRRSRKRTDTSSQEQVVPTQNDNDPERERAMVDTFLQHLRAGHEKVLEEFQKMAYAKQLTSRAAQTILSEVSQEEAIYLASSLSGSVREAVKHKHANHVVQKIVEVLPIAQTAFIVNELRGAARETAVHRFGCRVLCRILEHQLSEASPIDAASNIVKHDYISLVDELLGGVKKLLDDEFGSYVARHLLEFGSHEHKRCVVAALVPRAAWYAKRQLASHVVEAALRHCAQEDQQALTEALLAQNNIAAVATNQYGNHVIRALLKIEPLRSKTELALKNAEEQLNGSRLGKALLKMLPTATSSDLAAPLQDAVAQKLLVEESVASSESTPDISQLATASNPALDMSDDEAWGDWAGADDGSEDKVTAFPAITAVADAVVAASKEAVQEPRSATAQTRNIAKSEDAGSSDNDSTAAPRKPRWVDLCAEEVDEECSTVVDAASLATAASDKEEDVAPRSLASCGSESDMSTYAQASLAREVSQRSTTQDAERAEEDRATESAKPQIAGKASYAAIARKHRPARIQSKARHEDCHRDNLS